MSNLVRATRFWNNLHETFVYAEFVIRSNFSDHA